MIINPKEIPKEDLPLVVLSSYSNRLLSFLIRKRTKAVYNHVMLMVEPQYFATQDHLFKSVPVENYMKQDAKLKFWSLNISVQNKIKIIYQVNEILRLPWYKRYYDYSGLIGQLTGLRWINNPFRSYCSESVRNIIMPHLGYIKEHPTPGEINKALKNFEDVDKAKVYGRWYYD